MIWTWFAARVAWLIAVVAAVFAAVGLLRRDAKQDATRDMKEADRDKADDIRDRVAAVRRPDGVSDDDRRGYRD